MIKSVDLKDIDRAKLAAAAIAVEYITRWHECWSWHRIYGCLDDKMFGE